MAFLLVTMMTLQLDRFHRLCSNLNMKKKQLTRFPTVPSTVTSRVTRGKNSLFIKTWQTELRFRTFLAAVGGI